jgi:hypothetical protein
VVSNVAKAFVHPTVSGFVGQVAEIDGVKYRINGVLPLVDGRGHTRLKVFQLQEVGE